jgi:hypothetical protein
MDFVDKWTGTQLGSDGGFNRKVGITPDRVSRESLESFPIVFHANASAYHLQPSFPSAQLSASSRPSTKSTLLGVNGAQFAHGIYYSARGLGRGVDVDRGERIRHRLFKGPVGHLGRSFTQVSSRTQRT